MSILDDIQQASDALNKASSTVGGASRAVDNAERTVAGAQQTGASVAKDATNPLVWLAILAMGVIVVFIAAIAASTPK